MFVSRKRFEELEDRVAKLEAKTSKDIWDAGVIETFEYGRTTVRSMIRKMAAHMYKEETANRSNGKQSLKD